MNLEFSSQRLEYRGAKRMKPSKSNQITMLLVSSLLCRISGIENIPTTFNPSQQSPDRRTGKIDDATCHVEELEEANDSQLFTILHDLKHTEFFRNFDVDLDATCPLTWDKKADAKEIETSTTSTAGVSTPGGFSGFTTAGSPFQPLDPFGPPDDGKCAGGLEEMDPEETQSACHVDLGEGAESPFMSNTSGDQTSSQEEKEDSDFDCDGGSIADEMEEDETPLCELTEAEMTEYYDANESKTPIRDVLSSALNSLNTRYGWESPAQEDTFIWSTKTNPVVLSHSSDEECDDEAIEGRLPDTFWLDMCANIKQGEGMKMVDLALNPERNTGYNGTHIWRAIYEENCVDLDGVLDQPMCYEERFLYRLLSGLHASTTLSIAKNYYPPNKRKGRIGWEPNALYFYEQFGDHPEYIRNLHFSYVVLLRALKKAYPILNKYEIRTGNIVDDETATILLRRLLDSSILKSCNHVFTAFDESLMFRQKEDESPLSDVEAESKSKFPTGGQQVVTLQQNFKGVFHNISSILDCVQCQQCKLHGKMAMLGYGTALKILFMTNDELIASSLSRNEIVAFVNTIAKMSEAVRDVRELTNLYWNEHVAPSSVPSPLIVGVDDPLDAAIGAVATLANTGMISLEREAELVRLALEGDEPLLMLAKHYSHDLDKFLLFLQDIGPNIQLDAIVVGTGLAGLAASLQILDRGGKVLIVEKEHLLGGNSNKASSGINACCPSNSTTDDFRESFIADTIKSAGIGARPDLIRTLVSNSGEAVTWLKERIGVDLSLVAQLGGHQYKRTHRPKNGMVGAEVIYGMQRAVKEFVKSGQVQILTDTKVLGLLVDENERVNGVQVAYLSQNNDGGSDKLYAPNVILATGGFAADRTDGSYLSKYRPELMNMPATAGGFSTGDGIGLATTVGAGLVDMDKVQIHPTGWVDSKDPTNPNKILAAELMRGVGGILINSDGERFCNELGTRAYVTDMMLSHNPYYAEHRIWDKTKNIPTFSLVLASSAAANGQKHIEHYIHKGLLTRIEGVQGLADWLGKNVSVVNETLLGYVADADKGSDQWGKSSFQGKPSDDLDNEIFYVGTVTPVLHYCMGGITIDTQGNVLGENGIPIPGLHAAGEVTGGVHGHNRLGGNSLLECTVYGSIIGKKIAVKQRMAAGLTISKGTVSAKKLEEITNDTLLQHSSEEDCWVAIHGDVYDLTEFAGEHPAGAESIHVLCGTDGTGAFQTVHNKKMLDDFDEDKVGPYVS